jgi:hypothetical protein
MEVQNSYAFGYIEIEPVQVVKKDGLILPETKGIHATKIGRVVSGHLKDKLILYLGNTQVKAECTDRNRTFVPISACYATVTADSDEEVIEATEVSKYYSRESEAEWRSY